MMLQKTKTVSLANLPISQAENFGGKDRREPTGRGPKVHVAYVVHAFVIGGLQRCVAQLINRLDPDRFQTSIVCLDRNGGASGWIENERTPVIELCKRAGNDVGVVARLARTLRENRVHVVHSHNWGTLLETAVARRWARIPVHVHAERGTLLGDVERRGLRARLRETAARWALNRADCVVAVAESLREKLIQRCGRLNSLVRVIPNGVSRPSVTASATGRDQRRRSLGVTDDACLIGSVGRLVGVKDFGNAIDAVSQLREQAANVHLVLIGDGPEREFLADLARKKGVEDRIHLAGHQDDIGDWLAIMDVYLNVSLSEGMSQSVLEAMASGLPMVVTDVGDSARLVDGDCPCGLVVPPGDPTAVVGAVRELLSDRSTRESFSQNALARHAACYNLDNMVKIYERLYSNLLPLGAFTLHCQS